MKRPAFQFYPDNWRNNSNLRRCSWAARGVWVEVICLMHDADRYGVLPWTLKEIGQALGCPMNLLRELVEKGVLKGCDTGECEPYVYTPRSGRKDGKPVTLVGVERGPLWYSSRMVRDEYVRNVRGESTRYSDNDAPPDASPKGGIGAAPKPAPSQRQSDGSSTSSPSSTPSEYSSSLRSDAAQPAAGPAEPPPDARTSLFSEGLARMRRLTGKSDGQCRSLLGRMLRDTADDAALVMLVLVEAEQQRPADPIAWLNRAVEWRMGGRRSTTKPSIAAGVADLMADPMRPAGAHRGFDFEGEVAGYA